MNARVKGWFHNLGAAVITGASSSALASLGITVADVAGAGVTPLNWKQLAVVTTSGGVIGLLAYLKQSPLPADEADETKGDKE